MGVSLVTPEQEWLEADGRGGFAMGTATGERTRRYHALLLTAATPPTGRVVLVNGAEVEVETPAGVCALSSQRYAPDVVHPDGAGRVAAFTREPWPTWTYALPGGARILHEVMVVHDRPVTLLRWRLECETEHGGLDAPAAAAPGTAIPGAAALRVRLLLSGRDYHALHHENGAFDFQPEDAGDERVWRPYPGLPPLRVRGNGAYRHAPDWYRHFLYTAERERGLDATEDLASPGVFTFDLARGPAELLLSAEETPPAEPAAWDAERLRAAERARRVFPGPLHRAADAYLVRRGAGRTLVAGYPWFTDWGRDTFIALRGLLVAAGRLDEARDILLEWAGAVSEGMLPNRFPDRGEAPEYNAVDASLWYVIAVHEYREARAAAGTPVPPAEAAALDAAVQAILAGYHDGTRYGIRADADGLLACGAPGVQLTWMDAKVGDQVITPRTGKPVEIQALWLNALLLTGRAHPRWAEVAERGRAAFRRRFWNAAGGYLHDVVDVDHVPGTHDPTFRPNQVLAVGGLPHALLDGPEARAVVDAVERRLLTPLGLRSLEPAHPDYAPRYEGDGATRDARYHQGTVWPWLIGPFVEAWLRVRDDTAAARAAARTRFLEPLLAHLDEAGLGHISEIVDADAPHRPRGCPFQAWSVGEALRLDAHVLAPFPSGAGPDPGQPAAPPAPGAAQPAGSSSRSAARRARQKAALR